VSFLGGGCRGAAALAAACGAGVAAAGAPGADRVAAAGFAGPQPAAAAYGSFYLAVEALERGGALGLAAAEARALHGSQAVWKSKCSGYVKHGPI